MSTGAKSRDDMRQEHADMERTLTTGTTDRHECCAPVWQAPR